MYGDQVLFVMHHRFALVTLNLGQPAQEVPLIANIFLIKIKLYSQINQKKFK
jgi:hypothetical protein